MTFVLDCSVVIAALLPDEKDPVAVEILDRAHNTGAVVPLLWPLEVANALLIAQRRKRIDEGFRLDALARLAALHIGVDGQTALRAWFDISTLADRRDLTVYDSAYLELALRNGLPLATFDARLARAARQEGIVILTR